MMINFQVPFCISLTSILFIDGIATLLVPVSIKLNYNTCAGPERRLITGTERERRGNASRL